MSLFISLYNKTASLKKNSDKVVSRSFADYSFAKLRRIVELGDSAIPYDKPDIAEKRLTIRRLYRNNFRLHLFHIVTPSPWPFLVGFAMVLFGVGAGLSLHRFEMGPSLFWVGFFFLSAFIYLWFRDIVREGTYQGAHTSKVQSHLRLGIILFILSEVMFFLSFFWAFFHSSLAPCIEIGSIWPPVGISVLDPWSIPLANTVILLYSGISVTYAHHAIIAGMRSEASNGFLLTIGAAIAFVALQFLEYTNAPFSISDGIYGSTFFLTTGFHGFHVFVGGFWLTVCYIRHLKYHFTTTHHIGFEGAAWYWHFVDVVWLFLFICFSTS